VSKGRRKDRRVWYHKEWYQNGRLHRDDDPAIKCGERMIKWYLNDREYNEEDYTIKIKEIKYNRTIDKNC